MVVRLATFRGTSLVNSDGSEMSYSLTQERGGDWVIVIRGAKGVISTLRFGSDEREEAEQRLHDMQSKQHSKGTT